MDEGISTHGGRTSLEGSPVPDGIFPGVLRNTSEDGEYGVGQDGISGSVLSSVLGVGSSHDSFVGMGTGRGSLESFFPVLWTGH